MNWGKIKRTIERDFKRNPAKTGVLLALLPVAGYFLGPLLWKALPKKGPEATELAAFVAPAANSTGQGVPNTTAKNAGPPRWDVVAAQIAADTRMTSAAAVGLRNPFQGEEPVPEQVAEHETSMTRDHDQERLRRPEDFGLQLTATIVGNNVRLATINGKQYRENAKLPIQQGTDRMAVAENAAEGFVVKQVSKKFVVLERGGRQYQLQLSR